MVTFLIFAADSLSESGEHFNNTATKNPNTPQVCRYTTLWNVSVFKTTIENKMTSVPTHFRS